jgi:hypothetical protein
MSILMVSNGTAGGYQYAKQTGAAAVQDEANEYRKMD